MAVLHGLAGKHVLDVGDRASGLRYELASGQDSEALLGGVEHLLDARHHARDVRGDEGVLHTTVSCVILAKTSKKTYGGVQC